MDIDRLTKATERLNTLTAQMLNMVEQQVVATENLNNSIDESIRLQGGNPPQRKQACARAGTQQRRPF